ncbi:hypothetical protein E2C01_036909 [Portunus trituberculatus]|uniref:Uncharacterized protein n=1 Tax=Portunus trituberculatus TaxID=210409 RepID=A0A5B7FCI3_PORTR|nr:hypothetical protein [Portunus trituberculatus]
MLEGSIIARLDTKTLDSMAWCNLLMSRCAEFGGSGPYPLGRCLDHSVYGRSVWLFGVLCTLMLEPTVVEGDGDCCGLICFSDPGQWLISEADPVLRHTTACVLHL